MLLPKLVSLNSLNFDFVECSFSEKIMNCKDKKDGLSREGSGRVGIYKATGITHCYTLECNYQSGRRLNHLYPKFHKKKSTVLPEDALTDSTHRMYQSIDKNPPSYTFEMFEDVGRSFLIGILDFVDDNPISRLPLSCYKCLDAVKTEIMNQNNIFVPGFKKVPKTSSGVTQMKKQVKGTEAKGSSSGNTVRQGRKPQSSSDLKDSTPKTAGTAPQSARSQSINLKVNRQQL